MSDLEIFGPVLLDSDPEEAMKATLELWMPTYLAMVTRKINRNGFTLPPPRSYTITSGWDHFPEEQLPAVLIMCDRAQEPQMDGRRVYRATYPITVGVQVAAPTRLTVDRLAKYYATAIRSLVTGKGSLGKLAESSTWLGTEYDPHVADREQRTCARAEVQFHCEFRNIVRRLTGPVKPDELPNPVTEPTTEPKPFPRVKGGNVTLNREPV